MYLLVFPFRIHVQTPSTSSPCSLWYVALIYLNHASVWLSVCTVCQCSFSSIVDIVVAIGDHYLETADCRSQFFANSSFNKVYYSMWYVLIKCLRLPLYIYVCVCAWTRSSSFSCSTKPKCVCDSSGCIQLTGNSVWFTNYAWCACPMTRVQIFMSCSI